MELAKQQLWVKLVVWLAYNDMKMIGLSQDCLLYTSDAADE